MELATNAWRDALAGLDAPTLVAPPDPGRSPIMPRSIQAELAPSTTEALTTVARRIGVTPNSLLCTAWALTLRAQTGRDDIVFGSTVSGRPPEIPEVASIIGLFFNTIPVRIDPHPAEHLVDLFARVHRKQTDLLPFHHVNLADIQRQAGLGTLFDTLYVLRNTPKDADQAHELEQAVGLARITAADATEGTMRPAIATTNASFLMTPPRTLALTDLTRRVATHVPRHTPAVSSCDRLC